MGEIVQPGETEGHFYLLEATVRKKWYPISPRLWLLINPNCPNTFELDTLHLSLLNRMFFHFMSVMSQCLNANMSDMLEVTTKTARLLRMESVANQWLNGHGCYQAMETSCRSVPARGLPHVMFVWCQDQILQGRPKKGCKTQGVCLFVCLFVLFVCFVCLFFFWGELYVIFLKVLIGGYYAVDTTVVGCFLSIFQVQKVAEVYVHLEEDARCLETTNSGVKFFCRVWECSQKTQSL